MLAKFESGFTWRSFLAAVYALCIFSPAAIWLSLVTVGVSLAGAIQTITLLIFIEFFRFSGKPITKQEANLIFLLSSQAVSVTFIMMIYRLYFIHSPIALATGLTVEIPSWWAPPFQSNVWLLRTLTHTDWLMPIGIFCVVEIIGTIGAMIFALMGREIFIEQEKLEFPIQQINAQTIVVLTERSEKSVEILVIGALLALIYGIFLYAIPTTAQAAGYRISFIPIPWMDLTTFIEKIAPGAGFGIATDIMLIGLGLILPPKISISMLAGSIAIYFVGNSLTYNLGLTNWAEHWTPGMNFTQIFTESTLYLWAGPIIGISFAAGLSPILLEPKIIINAFKSLARTTDKAEERISGERLQPKVLFALLITVGLSLVFIYHILDPTFPIWALFVWEYPLMLVMMIITVRLLGETGIVWQMPYMQQMLTLATGYGGVAGWFLPLSMHPGTYWTMNFKMCQLTNTRISSLIKTYFVVFPITLLFGILYASAFWALAPMPSAVYPAPAVMWPIQALYQALWVRRPEQFWHPDHIVYSFISMLALCVVTQVLKLPISIAGLVGGITTPIPSIFTVFIGTVIGKIMARRIDSHTRLIFAAGLMLGEGMAIMIGSSAALVISGIWAKPY